MRRIMASLMRFAFAAVALQGAHTLAQEANPYNGTWAVQFDAPGRPGIKGTVDVNGQGGLWKTVSSTRSDTCAGRDAPIDVKSATPEKLVFRVMRSQVLAGCPDFTISMNRVDDNNLEGAMHNGWKVQMTRQ